MVFIRINGTLFTPLLDTVGIYNICKIHIFNYFKTNTMKKLLLVLLFVPFLTFSQWTVKKDNDPFDGESLIVYASGSGGDFPYKSPTLVFRKKREKSLEIYVSDAGSTACGGLYVSFSFGDANNVITFKANESLDGDAGFLDTSDLDSVLKLIDGLKKKSFVYVQWKTGCSMNRFKISLTGSSKALSNIFDSSWDEKANKVLASKKKKTKDVKSIEEVIFKFIYAADKGCKFCISTDEYVRITKSIIEQYQGDAKGLWDVAIIRAKKDFRIIIETIKGEEELERVPRDKTSD
tara:strand:+ start:352 stop:1227 length:876 start_codon:yes stop_codon:yes gene_type:complete